MRERKRLPRRVARLGGTGDMLRNGRSGICIAPAKFHMEHEMSRGVGHPDH